MVKNFKNKVMVAALTALAIGNVMSVSAATSAEPNSAEYSGYVTKLQDYVSEDLIKTTKKDDGTNVVEAINKGSWCSWIGNYLGMQVTDKVSYSEPDTYYMPFQREAQIESNGTGHLKTQLHVSTTLLNFGSTNTSGIWSPDTIN